MAQKIISDTTLQAWADAIREKEGSTGSIKVSDMAQRILDLASGGGEFLGGAIETGTFITTEVYQNTHTIPHNLGSIKGFFFFYDIDYMYIEAYIIDEIRCVIIPNADGSYTEISQYMSYTITNNSDGTVTIQSPLGLNDNVQISYLLIGA